MTLSIGTSVNLNTNLWENGVFPIRRQFVFQLKSLGVCSYLLKCLWQALCNLHLTFTSGIILVGILSETLYAVVCVCVFVFPICLFPEFSECSLLFVTWSACVSWAWLALLDVNYSTQGYLSSLYFPLKALLPLSTVALCVLSS